MNLTNEQKRTILADAPMGATHYSQGPTYYCGLACCAFSHYRINGDNAYYWANYECAFKKCSNSEEWKSKRLLTLGSLQKEVDAEDKAVNTARFNQCVQELSEAAWMNNGEPQYYDIYKRSYRDMQEAEKRKVLAGSEWQNGDKCLTPMKKKATVLGKTPRGSVAILIDGTMDDFRAYFAKDLTHPDAEEQKAVKELDEKAAELCKARCDAFGYTFDWDALPEDKKQGYRNMIKAGVVLNEEAAK